MVSTLVIWWLASVGAAAAVAYGSDYGARLPLYDDPPARTHDSEDYRAHSPDAPASLDYKYEEDARGKIEQPSVVEATETDSWQRPTKQHTKRPKDQFSFEPDDEFPERKSTRFTRHRPRFESRKLDRHKDFSPRYLKSSQFKKNKDLENDDELFVDGDFAEDKSRSLNNYLSHGVHKTTDERIGRRRRKPRDEYMHRKSDDEDMEKSEGVLDSEIETWKQEQEEGVGRRRPSVPRIISSDDEPVHRPRPQPRQRNNYNEYDSEYYDMKRVMNVKNQLTTLMWRTQAWSLVPAPPVRPVEEVLPNRRFFAAAPPKAIITEFTDSDSPLTQTTTELSTIPAPILTFTATTSQPTLIIQSTAILNDTKELSFAEKSRLSILKKSQRKESLRGQVGTSKPPVLLQVTEKMPTLVMVQPPSSAHPWRRALVVTEESPHHLRRVKQLMRQKLLANARRINDLTENWDDLVCDYIDTSLLDSDAHLSRPRTTFLLFIYSLACLIRRQMLY